MIGRILYQVLPYYIFMFLTQFFSRPLHCFLGHVAEKKMAAEKNNYVRKLRGFSRRHQVANDFCMEFDKAPLVCGDRTTHFYINYHVSIQSIQSYWWCLDTSEKPGWRYNLKSERSWRMTPDRIVWNKRRPFHTFADPSN